jgi:hypothetical protein
MNYKPCPCPKCGSESVETTTMGGIDNERYDDINRATCTKCKHRGTAGDWQRIKELLDHIDKNT